MKIPSCKKVAELSCDFVDGALPAKKQFRVDAHLQTCAACRAAVERVREVRAMFQLSEVQPPVLRVPKLVRATVAAEKVPPIPQRERRESRLPWLASLAFHALVVALAALVSFSFDNSNSGNAMGLSFGEGQCALENGNVNPGAGGLQARFPAGRHAVNDSLNSAAVERSVRAALAYLAREQQHDGGWDAKTGCRVQDTALAVLACNRAGAHYHSAFQSADLQRGIAWLILHCHDTRDPSDPAIVALALSDALRTHDSVELRTAAQECVAKLGAADTRDPTVRGWTVLALKSAEDAGLTVPRVNFAQMAATSQLNAAALLLQRRVLEDGAAAPALALHAPDWGSTVEEKSPDFQSLDGWYFGSLSLRKSDGINWKSWNSTLARTLIPHQRQDNFLGGTWDAGPGWDANSIHCAAVGALCLGTLVDAK